MRGPYYFDVDLASTSNFREIVYVKRKVSQRTILLFCSQFQNLDFWTRNYLAELLRMKMAVSGNRSLVMVFYLRMCQDTAHIDKRWDGLICEMVHRGLHLESEMWRLSTLGGAMSAMGFFSERFMEYALKVSFKQLNLALMIGDPVLVSRCRLYISLGLAQKGRYRLAFQIIRNEWKIGRELKSELLQNCAQGVWSTAKWLRTKRWQLGETNFIPS